MSALLLIVLILLNNLANTLIYNDDPPPQAITLNIRQVTSSAELRQALLAAQPGDSIQLADGIYSGTFDINVSGAPSAPIILQGTRNAIIQGTSLNDGYGLHIQANYWILRGFTITNVLKGIMTDGASHNIFDDLRVFHIGHEAIHFRSFSTDNTVVRCEIADTGLINPGLGEGVYIGSAKAQWPKFGNGKPDASDGNRVSYNHFGPDIRAEAIDVKEGTSNGEIHGNAFNGIGMSGQNFADSWVDLKGNGYSVRDNRGFFSLNDGFQTHIVVAGWGRNNQFSNNVAELHSNGYAIRIQLDGKTAAGNIVYNDNRASRARAISNVPLTPQRVQP